MFMICVLVLQTPEVYNNIYVVNNIVYFANCMNKMCSVKSESAMA